MTKHEERKQLSNKNLSEDDWCPLFGSLPTYGEKDGIAENCLYIISEARRFWNGFEYSPGLKCPSPEIIEKHIQYPATWIKSARLLTEGNATTEIIFNALHDQGIYEKGSGWIEGKGGEIFLLCDVDQLSDRYIINTVRNRAGIEHDFDCAILEADEIELCKDENPVITPAMIYALMAIGIAWNLIKDVTENYVNTKSEMAFSELLAAETLLKSANRAALHEIDIEDAKNKKNAKVYGNMGYEKGIGNKHKESHIKHNSWRQEASKIRKNSRRRSKLSNEEVARKIKEQTGAQESIDWIRKIIARKN